MVFADDERESNPASFKFLQMAHAWKLAQAKKAGASAAVPADHKTTPPTNDAERGQADDDAISDVASSHSGE